MVYSVRVLDAAARRMVDRSGPTISRMFDRMLTQAGRELRDLVRENIKTEGQTFDDPWKKPSKWIVAKKAARKALSGMYIHVKSRTRRGSAEVYFDSPGDWSIEQHHKGFTVPPTGGRVTIQLARPSALGRSGRTFSFMNYRASKVPRRRIWPTAEQTHRFLRPVTATFAKDLGRELTR